LCLLLGPYFIEAVFECLVICSIFFPKLIKLSQLVLQLPDIVFEISEEV